MRGSIRKRLTLAFIGLAIGPLLLVGIILAWQSFITQEQQALNLQREVAQHVSSQVKAFLDGLESELRLVNQIEGLQKLDQDKQRNILGKLLSYQDAFESLVLLDSQGQEQARATRSSISLIEPGARIQANEFVTSLTSGQTYYSPVYFNETTGEPFITIAVPLYDVRTGRVDGVLVSEVRLKRIWDLIMNLQTQPGQSVYIVDAQNKVVAHHNPSMVLRGTTFDVPDHDGTQPGLASVSPVFAEDMHKGLSIQSLVTRLTSPNAVLAVNTVRFGEQEFNIIAEQTVAESLALAITTIFVTMGLIVAALVLSVILGLVIVRQVVQPIQAMAMTAQAISAGDLSRQVQVTNRDEVGVLAVAFNSMTAQLRQSLEGLEQQVVEVKQAEESLRRAKETLQALIDYSPLAITMLDLDSRVLLWNTAAQKIYGWTAEEVLGEFIPFVREDQRAKLRTIYERVNKGEILTNLELEWMHKDGSRILTGVSIAPLRDSTGNVHAHMSIAADITERKRAEQALRESEQRFRAIFDSINDAIFVHDLATGTILDVNARTCTMYGCTRDEALQSSIQDLSSGEPPYSQQEGLVRMQKTIEEGPQTFEWRAKAKDGQLFWVEVNMRVAMLGSQDRMLVAVRDITERKQAEQALRESEERLRQIASSLRETIWLRDSQTRRVLYVNPAFEHLTGWTCESFYEDPDIVINAIHPDDKEEVIQALDQRFEGKLYNKEHRIIHRDGSVRWISSRSFPVRNEAGAVFRWASIMEDITERKQAETERERLIIELENRNAELERFTYTVSHDLKTPLITIRGFLGYIEQDALSGDMERVKEDMQRITNATTKMQDLLNDLLELSRIGRLMNPPQNFSLETLIHETLNLMEDRLQERNVKVNIPSNLPVVFGDAQRWSEVFQNLLDNAVKFMGEQPEPIIEIGTQGEENGMPVCYIRDNGIGISPKYHERIFGLFNKLNPGVEGTGVGLAIVKRIIEVHGGRIWVESEEGQGATFYFTLGKGTQGL